MFYAKSNTSKQEVNLNTNFFTSYSETAQVTAGGWNTQLSIKVKPCVGQDANGIRQYAEDRSQIISTSITVENAIALLEGFEAEVVPALNGEKSSGAASIVMGNADQRKILTIGYADGNAYLSVAVALDENGKAGGEIKHIFNKKSYLINYDPSTGKPEEKIVEADLINFMEKVRSIKDLAPITAHSIKYNEMNRAAFSGNSGTTPTPNYQANSTPSQGNTGYQAPVTNSTSMDDFLPF
jgi:hypothetical protein